MVTQRYDVLIVGAGHGGAQLAAALRQRGFTGSIALVGDEALPPYERPPLSKEYLSREKSFDRILLRAEGFWSERDIHLLLGQPAVAVDPVAQVVRLGDDTAIGFGDLVWATGGSPRRLECAGNDLLGVHTVRNRADVDQLMSELDQTQRVAIIGGGYIGLEAAAVLSKLGKQITLIEAQERILARVAGEAVSRFYEAEHRAHGIDIRLGTTVACLEGSAGRISGVRLGDGSILPCDMAIVGIGIVPAIQPLLAAGALGDNGILVDEFCRTSLPHIFALGDCVAGASRFADSAVVRIESVQNANDQAATVAKFLTGSPEPYDAVPWFWSNQFDLKLQTVGLSTGHDQTVVRGDPATRSFSVVYLREGRVIALDCINATRDYVQGRMLVTNRARADTAAIADTDIALKSLMPLTA